MRWCALNQEHFIRPHWGHFVPACAGISDAKFDHLVKVVMPARPCHCKHIFLELSLLFSFYFTYKSNVWEIKSGGIKQTPKDPGKLE